MLHPSYNELIEKVNDTVEAGEEPIVNSRYSIVIAAAKRARQLIAGDEALIDKPSSDKPLSTAVEELYQGKVHIIGEEDVSEDEIKDI
ncbi:MAG: DNA-directed RNA polymerase subunit omega [Lachnospiraceae bacterium]|nr:DNA-directed RNA polymerase subunit omega [Lachnospiraceae bacterium]